MLKIQFRKYTWLSACMFFVLLLIQLTVFALDRNTEILDKVQTINLLSRSIDPEKTANSLWTAAMGNPNHEKASSAFYKAAVLYQKSANWDFAIEAYNKCLSYNNISLSKKLSCYHNIGDSYKYAKKYDKAVQSYQNVNNVISVEELKQIYDKSLLVNKITEETYFEGRYQQILSSNLEMIDVLEKTRNYKQAADALIELFEWFTKVHWDKQFYEADTIFGTNRDITRSCG